MNRVNAAWLSGFLDGEGCIHAVKGKYPIISASQVDRELLDRIVSLVAVGNIAGPRVPKKGQPFFTWQANGFEHVQYVVALMWPWLSTKRREKAREVLLAGRSTPARRLASTVEGWRPGGDTCSKGHPYTQGNTLHAASGKRQCRTCNRENARARRIARGVTPRGPYGPRAGNRESSDE